VQIQKIKKFFVWQNIYFNYSYLSREPRPPVSHFTCQKKSHPDWMAFYV
jgi:hypothetical protein